MTDILSRLPELRALLTRLDWSVGEQNSVAMTELAVMFSDGQLARALLDHIEGLEKALRPFADVSGEGNEDFADDTAVIVTFGRTTDYSLRLGDLRRAARAILAPAPETEAPQRLTDHERMMKGDLR